MTEVPPPWLKSPGANPRSAIMRMTDVADDWLAGLRMLSEQERQAYLDRHVAPAVWRSWLDELVSLRHPAAQAPDPLRGPYYRVGAPMRRSVPNPDEPCPLEGLVRAIRETGRPPAGFTSLTEEAWRRATIWGLRDLLVLFGHPEAARAEQAVADSERGILSAWEAALNLRRRVQFPTIPSFLAHSPEGS